MHTAVLGYLRFDCDPLGSIPLRCSQPFGGEAVFAIRNELARFFKLHRIRRCL